MKPLSERNPVVVGIVGLILVAVFALVAFNANNLPVIGGGTTYTAYFTEAAGLTPGNEVRVAGVTVGKVSGVALAGNRVLVSFRVKGVWVGDESTVAIKIKTLLGDKYLALDPLGPSTQNPAVTIPASRTSSPLDVTAAFQQLGSTIGQINTTQLAQSLEAISSAFRNTPPYVRSALTGLADLSQTISSRDIQLAQLLRGTRQVTQMLSDENSNFRALLGDGNLLLAELQQRQRAISALLTGTQAMATQISGLVRDDNAQLAPTLRELNQVTTVLADNQANLRKALALAGTYYRLIGNVLGNGRWFDVYLCGVVPRSYAPTVVPPTGCEPPKVTSQPPGLGGGG
jgi:phospholipid/cholesterol/gamma-HCH transport system substrate-binding protein